MYIYAFFESLLLFFGTTARSITRAFDVTPIPSAQVS